MPVAVAFVPEIAPLLVSEFTVTGPLTDSVFDDVVKSNPESVDKTPPEFVTTILFADNVLTVNSLADSVTPAITFAVIIPDAS